MTALPSYSAPPPPRCEGDDIRWQVRPEWRQVLLGAAGLRLEEWLDAGCAQVVKHGDHRTVYRVDLPDRSFFLKHYRCADLRGLGRHLVRASASRREYQKAVELIRRRVPTFRPVALGEEDRNGLVGDNFLVTEAIPHAISLSEYVSQHLPRLAPELRLVMGRRLVAALAQLCAAAHRAGVFHDDFHGGNVLVRLDTCLPLAAPDAPPELYLVDLPGIRLTGPLDWPHTRDSLVMLNSDWADKASLADRWRFWVLYARQRAELRIADPRAAAEEIAWHTRDYACRVMRGRDKRSLRSNRDYYAVTSRQAIGHAVTGVAPSDLVRLMNAPQRLLRESMDRPLKLSHSSVVVEAEFPIDGAPARVVYKRTRVKGWWKRLLAWARRSRAMTSWVVGHALAERGIATTRPLAVCIPRGWRARCEGYVLSEWIDGAQNLHLYAWQLAQQPPGPRARRAAQAAFSLGRLVGRLHAWRIAHRDLKGCNLLLAEKPGTVDAYLLDMEGVRILRRLSRAEQVRNLARLAASIEAHPWVSRTDRMRFLRSYAREQLPAQVDLKALWRDVAAAAAVILRRFARRGIPVA